MGIRAILNGHTNELLGLNLDISKKRLKICEKCPLYKQTILGPICNNKLWMDPITGKISTQNKDNYIKGCGCRLNAKTTVFNLSCPVNKW